LRRLFIISEGFFEWKKGNQGNQPYFIRPGANIKEKGEENTGDLSKIEENTGEISRKEENTGDISRKEENTGEISRKEENTGDISIDVENTGELSKREEKDVESPASSQRRSLLFIAGLYDLWKNVQTNELVYTYTLITTPAHQSFLWLHDRMPF